LHNKQHGRLGKHISSEHQQTAISQFIEGQEATGKHKRKLGAKLYGSKMGTSKKRGIMACLHKTDIVNYRYPPFLHDPQNQILNKFLSRWRSSIGSALACGSKVP
jgi:hypothetical protein